MSANRQVVFKPAAHTPAKPPPPPPPHRPFEFIVGTRPDQLNGSKVRRVKSHASRLGWREHKEQTARRPYGLHGKRPRKQPGAGISMTFEAVVVEVTAPAELPGLAKVPDFEEKDLRLPPLQYLDPEHPMVEYQLGGGRIDPFRAHPGEHKAYFPALIDHYLVHMAVDIPELDQPGNLGLLRTRWFPLVISDIATFQTVMLLSAYNAASVNPRSETRRHVLDLSREAIVSITDACASRPRRAADATIGAVAKMASFEAMRGNAGAYRMHMEGLRQMVFARGGLDALGLGGLLRRIIVWIDLNSSFLLELPRYFPGHHFADEIEVIHPNPQGFLAP